MTLRETVRASTVNGRPKDGRLVSITWVNKQTKRCRCAYTGAEFDYSDGIILGPVIPQAPASFLCAPGADVARRESVRLFQDTVDMNCNTCAKLERLPHNNAALMPGRCKAIPVEHPYHRGEFFLFHPEDCMGMECHTSRRTT